MADRLLTVEQVADRLGTTVRFPRRLIEERRIEYVKLGRHVRIPERAVNAFVASHTVAPAVRRLRGAA
ncbi:excisionase family DNA-binding protein [Streptomyces rimosus]|uniref:excisionase family DNA-binding protein n=1 Tax=Streptomyces rimosus TaxID=1927 RepID=UPI0004C70954|nr:excisionase family DNA-binding protein [Streptomyces rimosus]